MLPIKLLTIILVFLGTGFMLASIVASVNTNKGVPQSLRNKWLILTYLMVFFLVGYVAFLIVRIMDLEFHLEVITSIVFLGGACFVFLVVNLTRETVTNIRKSKNQVNEINEKLLQKNIELEQQIAARLNAEKSLQRAHDGLEIRVKERTIELTATLDKLQQEINDRKHAEKALTLSHAELNQIFNSAADGMIVVNKDFQILKANETFLNMLSLSESEIIERTCFDIFPGPNCNTPNCLLTRILKEGDGRLEREVDRMRSDGRIIPCILTATPYRDPDGQIIGIIEDFKDITDRKLLEAKLHEMSITDDLTGLYNRRGFLSIANERIKLASRVDETFFLLYVDIDNMKWINDTLGHNMGDQALVETADLLRNTFRETDVIGVGRLGGDEFAILLMSSTDASTEHPVLKRLEENMKSFNQQEGRSYKLMLSTGIAQYDSKNPCSVEELISQADSLMYESKKKKKSSNAAAAKQ